jgi:hypothetical protein
MRTLLITATRLWLTAVLIASAVTILDNTGHALTAWLETALAWFCGVLLFAGITDGLVALSWASAKLARNTALWQGVSETCELAKAVRRGTTAPAFFGYHEPPDRTLALIAGHWGMLPEGWQPLDASMITAPTQVIRHNHPPDRGPDGKPCEGCDMMAGLID